MTVAYVTFPGVDTDFISTDDVNLFPSDTAHFHQSVGGWSAGADASAFAHDVTGTPAPPYGDGTGKATTDGGGPIIATLSSPSLSAVEYTVSVDVWSDTADREGFVRFNGTNGTVTALTAGWTRLSCTKTVTAGTKTIEVHYRDVDDSSPGNGEEVWLARACIRTGSSALFIPSLRIVGDLDIETKLALADWTPAAYNSLVSTTDSGGANGFMIRVEPTTGKFGLIHGSGSYREGLSAGSHALTDGAAYTIRATMDVSTGGVAFFIDGIAAGTPTVATGAGSGSGLTLVVGGTSEFNWPVDGDIYYCEIRDGIDGPVVRRFDADDLIGLL